MSFLNDNREELSETITSHTGIVTDNDNASTSSPEAMTKLEELSSFNISDMLSLPPEVKNAFIEALNVHDIANISVPKANTCTSCYMSIGFFDDDLLFESKHQNRPLFVS